MVKENNSKKNYTWIYLIIIILLLAMLNITLVVTNSKKIEKRTVLNTLGEFNDRRIVTMALPAVDSEGKGTSAILKVEIMPGSGKTLTEIDNLLFWADTQHSIRIAKIVAENITQINLGNYDLIYSIIANASIIGGPSAGAALTIATISAVINKTPKSDIMITGTINHDGTIGPVSAILEKAIAAKKAGATNFIVPMLQSKDIIYETREHCEKFGSTKICYTETYPKKISVGDESGINISEVSEIREAMKYFFD